MDALSLGTPADTSCVGLRDWKRWLSSLPRRNCGKRTGDRVAGIGTQTLLRWLKIREFQAAYGEARRAAVSQSNARLQQASSAAVATLLKIMVDPSAPASTRVRAADRVLEHAKQSIENEDIAVRVAALEQAMEERHEVHDQAEAYRRAGVER
jgi:hypothetical protein